MTLVERSQEWLQAHLLRRVTTRRLPFSGSFELTWRCNFRCIHCYLQELRAGGPELHTEAVLRLLEELADTGCIGLAFTGGEPLLRADFREILAQASHSGFLVALFTNGSRVDAAWADFLATHPPRSIEVSLYGASEDTYERITGARENFRRTVTGINHLLHRDLPVRLKAVLLEPLADEIGSMRALAKSLGLTLHVDARVDATLAGDRSPVRLRVDPRRAAQIELDDPARVSRLVRDGQRARARVGEYAQQACGAGQWSFHLDPAGRLLPCMLVREPAIDAATLGFRAAWEELGTYPRVAYPADSACARCEMQHLCSHCPGADLVDGAPLGLQACFDCELAQLRAQVLEQTLADQRNPADSDE